MAWLLGAAGATALLVQQGFTGRALAIAALAAAWEVLLRHRPRRPALAWGIVVLGLVLVPLATWSVIGRAPALVAMVGVLVADAALVDWSPTPRWPVRSVHVAAFAVLPVAAAQFNWYRSERVVVALALLVLGLLVVEAYHRFPDALARADGWFLHALVLVGTWIGAVVLFVVVAVLLYLPGVIGRGRDAVRRRRVESYWLPATGARPGRAPRRRPSVRVHASAGSGPPSPRRARRGHLRGGRGGGLVVGPARRR